MLEPGELYPSIPTTPPTPSGWRRAVVIVAVAAMVAAGGALLGSAARSASLFSGGSGVAAPTGLASPSSPGSSSFDPRANTGSVTPSQSASTSGVAAGLVNITTTLANGAGAGAGTGMVISSSGEVLTNNHVIDNAEAIRVEIGSDGSAYPAKVVGYSRATDVALLKITGVSGLDTVPIGSPDTVGVDDPIVVLGNALGRGGAPTETPGTVTALRREITASDADGRNAETLTNMIEVQADVQPGDSGGALVDSNGKVVGMTTAASTQGFRFQQMTTGVGFAIRIDDALSVAKQIRNGEEVGGVHVGGRALLGVALQDTSASTFGRRFGNASPGSGAYVTDVGAGTPAEGAGITAGDVIVAIGDQTITSSQALQDAMNSYHPGDRVTVSWTDANGTTHHATVKLIEGPPA